MADNAFRRQLTPPFARIAPPQPGQDAKDALIDSLTIQLANATREIRRLTAQLADRDLSRLAKGAPADTSPPSRSTP